MEQVTQTGSKAKLKSLLSALDRELPHTENFCSALEARVIRLIMKSSDQKDGTNRRARQVPQKCISEAKLRSNRPAHEGRLSGSAFLITPPGDFEFDPKKNADTQSRMPAFNALTVRLAESFRAYSHDFALLTAHAAAF